MQSMPRCHMRMWGSAPLTNHSTGCNTPKGSPNHARGTQVPLPYVEAPKPSAGESMQLTQSPPVRLLVLPPVYRVVV